jgi:tetratricopeptide (TPR) repeat protein
MLVADKGHCTPVELCSQPSPSVVLHGSGFSLMVNFDLLARYVRERGGVAVLPREPARSLVVAAFVRGGRAGGLDDPARFESWVQDQLVDTGPDNYFALRPLLSGRPEPAIETMLAGLRLSRYEPSLLIELLPRLLDVLPTVPDSMRGEVERALMRLWDNWFPIGEPIDLALCLGLAFSAMDRFARAADFLELSVKDHPDSAPAAFAMGVARRGLRDLRVALEWAERAIQLEPGFSQARALRAVLVEELDAERGR